MPTSLPPYKPPKHIQELIEKRLQNEDKFENPQGKRRQTAVLPKRNWIYRNPRLFQITAITTSLLIFFSKPIYDAFIADPIPALSPPVPAHKR